MAGCSDGSKIRSGITGRSVSRSPNGHRRQGLSARSASSSKTTFAAANAVGCPAPSYAGATSTTSQPARLIPRKARRKATASALEKGERPMTLREHAQLGESNGVVAAERDRKDTGLDDRR